MNGTFEIMLGYYVNLCRYHDENKCHFDMITNIRFEREREVIKSFLKDVRFF